MSSRSRSTSSRAAAAAPIASPCRWRAGRRSGVLPPRFGASDIVRNNPNYRRHIENIGYYWAFSDYVDMTAWMNWRSSAGRDSLDRGW